MKLMPHFAERTFPERCWWCSTCPEPLPPQFAEQLAAVSQIPVKQAENGEILRAGQVYVCPGDCHLRVVPPGRIVLDDGPRIAGYRPSIDVTLESVAALAGANAVVAILTGMGNDGARGVMAIQENGGLVMAQDEVDLGDLRDAGRGHQDRRSGAGSAAGADCRRQSPGGCGSHPGTARAAGL